MGLWFFSGLLVFFISMFFGPNLLKDDTSVPNLYRVYIKDTYVGTVGDKQTAERYLQKARAAILESTEEITYVDADMHLEGRHAYFGLISSEDSIVSKMKEVLPECIQETLERSYMLKINNYLIALDSAEDVIAVLQAAIDKYDEEGGQQVTLEKDANRKFSVLTAGIHAIDSEGDSINRTPAGFTSLEEGLFDTENYQEELSFSDFDLGMLEMKFGDVVEVTECYLQPEAVSTVQQGINDLTVDQDNTEIYKVQSGDTLGGISLSTGIPLEEIIAMNDAIENEKSVIRVDQEIVINVPKPALTVTYTVTEYKEEEYSAEIEYVDNDEWYTTKQVTLQEPSNGFRKAVSNVTYENGEVVGIDILKQDVLMEAVPKIVERGTKIPPTYIKPLQGGTLTSGFGYRSLFGGSNHYGVDWATPTGTTVYASCGGTVTRAGWSSSYGYCVYISHPDGRETRYAHNSKLLVSVGDVVAQGQSIALSGNTGQSTGPHVHFEIRINGTPVNPLDYLD